MIHPKNNKKGFTLAEVLITLGIIGVVAALTIPGLIANHRKKVVEVRLKKFYSTYMNAIEMSQSENGDLSTWDYATQSVGTNSSNAENFQFFNKYLFQYMQGIQICEQTKCPDVTVDPEVTTNALGYSRYVFSDGSCFGILTGGTTSSSFVNIHGWYDYNCSGNPNKAGRDQFLFRMTLGSSDNYVPFQFTNDSKKISVATRTYLLEHCKTKPADCGALIQYDGWNVSKDYPIRL